MLASLASIGALALGVFVGCTTFSPRAAAEADQRTKSDHAGQVAPDLSQQEIGATIQNLLGAVPPLVERLGLEQGLVEFRRRIQSILGGLAVLGGEASDTYAAYWDEYWRAEYERVAAPAQQGDVEAQYTLALYYGLSTPMDLGKATAWLQRSSEQGSREAQLFLGHGKFARHEYAEAAHWYRLAAEQGDVVAQNKLGNMYYQGVGLSQDYAEAVKWWRLAAEQGHAMAQFNLGDMYYHGRGTPQDYVQAYLWVSLAAENLPPGEIRGLDAEGLNALAERMSTNQIAKAQRLAEEWRDRNQTRSQQ